MRYKRLSLQLLKQNQECSQENASWPVKNTNDYTGEHLFHSWNRFVNLYPRVEEIKNLGFPQPIYSNQPSCTILHNPRHLKPSATQRYHRNVNITAQTETIYTWICRKRSFHTEVTTQGIWSPWCEMIPSSLVLRSDSFSTQDWQLKTAMVSINDASSISKIPGDVEYVPAKHVLQISETVAPWETHQLSVIFHKTFFSNSSMSASQHQDTNKLIYQMHLNMSLPRSLCMLFHLAVHIVTDHQSPKFMASTQSQASDNKIEGYHCWLSTFQQCKGCRSLRRQLLPGNY